MRPVTYVRPTYRRDAWWVIPAVGVGALAAAVAALLAVGVWVLT